MNEPHDKPHDRPHTLRGRARQRILAGTAALPSLVTLGNGLAGFASIHFSTRPMVQALQGQAEPIAHNLVIAGWLILAGMICDALDGQLARLTRRTSDFGSQLDSLCDAITFGVAPAFLMLRAVQGDLAPYVGAVGVTPQSALFGRVVWFIAALYVSCAIMRLARFNVETKPDMLSHLNFWGLPSPGAALAVASLVLCHEHLKTVYSGWRTSYWLFETVIWAMPVITLAAAVLMVTRVRYPHLINRQLRGRRSFGHIIRLMAVVLAAIVIDLQIILAASAILYLAWPPIAAAGRAARSSLWPKKQA
jgi:CDP-diacylglycerol---serine O-phosphatidyltransferase